VTTNHLRVFPDALLAEAPADLPVEALEAALASHRLCFPPDPLDRTLTLRHMLDNHLGGRRRLRYGTLANYLRGATLATSSGQQLVLGGQTVKNVTGYALSQLVIGAKGRYGAVAALTLSLRPLPSARQAMLWGFPSVGQACAAANATLQAGLQPNALALLDAAPQAQVADALVTTPQGALLLAEFDGHPEALRRHFAQVSVVAERQQGTRLYEAVDNDGIAACWRAWEQLELRVSATNAPSVDLLLPRRSLAPFVARARAVAQAYRMQLLIWGDVGVGNLHPTLFDAVRPAEAYTAALLIWRAAQELGGVAGGERGNALIADALRRDAHANEVLAAAVAHALPASPYTEL
jgi:glycolate oxidase